MGCCHQMIGCLSPPKQFFLATVLSEHAAYYSRWWNATLHLVAPRGDATTRRILWLDFVKMCTGFCRAADIFLFTRKRKWITVDWHNLVWSVSSQIASTSHCSVLEVLLSYSISADALLLIICYQRIKCRAKLWHLCVYGLGNTMVKCVLIHCQWQWRRWREKLRSAYATMFF